MIDDAPRRSFLHSSATLNLSTRKLDLISLILFVWKFYTFELQTFETGNRREMSSKEKEKREEKND